MGDRFSLYFAPFSKCSTKNKHYFCNLKISCLKTKKIASLNSFY